MTDAALDDAALRAFLGRTVQGRYRIDALLGRGGMGAVFRAHHLALAQDVALKVLLPHARGGEIATARFRREARSASRLDHPHCVRVMDFGELDDGTKFLVMQLVPGEELKARLGSPWPPLAAVDVALQILEGLAHAHGRGVVHRDLKPENVLLSTDDEGRPTVKLVDFGIAKILEGEGGEDRLTRTGMRFGTPRYMSPEQAGGGKVDERTDLYAVGLLLYEMLAGHAPFQADDVAAMMRLQVLSPPPPLPGDVPSSLAAVAMRLLAKSRKQRFSTAKDTMSALWAVQAELASPPVSAAGIAARTLPTATASGVTTAVPGTWSAGPRRPRATRLPLWIAGGVLLALWVAVAIVAMTQTREPTAAASPSPAAGAPASTPRAPPRPLASRVVAACEGDECECKGSAPCDFQCTDDDCELECKGSADCRFTCGDECEARCKGSGDCAFDVGDDSRIECKGSGACDVTCRGDCVVECRGKGDCVVRCEGERAPGPRECGKKEWSCGGCP